MKRITALLLICVMVAAVVGCGVSETPETNNTPVSVEDFEPVTLRFSTMNPESHFSIDSVYRIKEVVEEKTNGNVKIDVYPGGQLGDYEIVTEELMRGTIDIAFQSAVDKFDARLGAHALPYMCTDYDELGIVYGPDSYLSQVYEDAYADLGIKFLGVFTEGFQGIGSSEKIQNPADPYASKNYMLRCAGIKAITDSFKELGFSVTTLPYSETLSGIQTGVVDGWVGGTSIVNYETFSDIINSFYLYKTYVEATHFIMNADRFNSLPVEYQQILMDAVQDECAKSYDLAREMDDEGMRLLNEAGIEAVYFTDEELQTMKEAVRTPVLEKSRSLMGDEFIDGLQKYLADNGL